VRIPTSFSTPGRCGSTGEELFDDRNRFCSVSAARQLRESLDSNVVLSSIVAARKSLNALKR
jgi:hypothetical protein